MSDTNINIDGLKASTVISNYEAELQMLRMELEFEEQFGEDSWEKYATNQPDPVPLMISDPEDVEAGRRYSAQLQAELQKMQLEEMDAEPWEDVPPTLTNSPAGAPAATSTNEPPVDWSTPIPALQPSALPAPVSPDNGTNLLLPDPTAPPTPVPTNNPPAPGASIAPPSDLAAQTNADGGAQALQSVGAQVNSGLEQSSALAMSLFEQMLQLIGSQNDKFGLMNQRISELNSQIKSLKNP